MRRQFNKSLCVSSWSPEKNKHIKKTRKKEIKSHWFAYWFNKYLRPPTFDVDTPDCYKFEQLNKLSGIHRNTLESWKYSKHKPNMSKVLRLVKAISKISGEKESYILIDLYRCWDRYSKDDEF